MEGIFIRMSSKNVLYAGSNLLPFVLYFVFMDLGSHLKNPLVKQGGKVISGADNEVWSYGERVYEICKKYMNIRENMRPYVKSLMKEAHAKGTPLMRPLFYDYPGDKKAWEIQDQYMFGEKIMVCPILYENERERKVYLPAGKWRNINNDRLYAGEKEYICEATLDSIPVFVEAVALEKL